MTDFGTEAAKVNSQAYTVTITNSSSGEYIFLQDARMVFSHTELKEPTTSGGNLYFSGTPTNRLIGTVIYTKDVFTQANIGFNTILFTRSQGETPTFSATITLTSRAGTATTFTFTTLLKLESADVLKAAEGGTKIAVSFIIIDDPTSVV